MLVLNFRTVIINNFRHHATDMLSNEFLVVKCNTCSHHIGKSRHTKSVNCTRCGDLICENSPIVASAADASDLQSLVAYHNMPDNLRSDFKEILNSSEKVPHEIESDFSSRIDTKSLSEVLEDSLNEEGFLTTESLTDVLKLKKLNSNAEVIIGMAEYEGYLLRLEHDKWKIID